MNEPLIASVLHLDRRAVKALKIRDAYSLHRVVYSLYERVRGDSPDSHSSGILYYAETVSAADPADFKGRRVLMLANRPPASSVEGGYGTVVSKPVPPGFLEHAAHRFKVLVNPVRRDHASGKLAPIKGREAVGKWFCQRSEAAWGFRVDESRLCVDKIEVLRFPDKKEHPVTIAQAQLRGGLTVLDRERFRHSFAHGVGRARAFGCGLLQIRPVADNIF
jgi:CRISPR system Cascade subunit CasE